MANSGSASGLFLVSVYIRAYCTTQSPSFSFLTIHFPFCMFRLVSIEISLWACSQLKWVRIASTIKKETFIHSTVGKRGNPCVRRFCFKTESRGCTIHIVEVESSHIYVKSSESVYCGAEYRIRSWIAQLCFILYFNPVNFIDALEHLDIQEVNFIVVHSANLPYNMK